MYIDILEAVDAGDIEGVKSFLQGKSHIDDETKNESLIYAIKEGSPDIVHLLIDAGADVNYSDKYNGTPLTSAIIKSYKPRPHQLENFKTLLHAGADVNKITLGMPPIFFAVREYVRAPKVCAFDYFNLLLDYGVDINTKDRNDSTLLMYACSVTEPYKPNQTVTKLTKYLIHNGADVNLADKFGSTALHYACRHSLPNVVITLVDHGADVNAQDREGQTPLHSFFPKNTKSYLKSAKYLIEHGADPYIKNIFGIRAINNIESEPEIERLYHDCALREATMEEPEIPDREW